MKKRIISIFLIGILALTQGLFILNNKVKAETNSFLVPVRIEGLNGTIAEGSAKGENALEIVKNVLNENKIPFTISRASWGSLYISSINGLSEKKFGGYDGWLYYIKTRDSVISPMSGLDGYFPKEGESIILYYGDFSTPYVNSIVFIPEIVKENERFKMKFVYKNFDWISNSEVITPIKGAIVSIDNINYITNDSGEIEITGLSKGEHTYRISGYNIDKLPTVVMDKGTFIIDNEHSPSFNYTDSRFNEVTRDNTGIVKDINKEIRDTLGYIKNNTAEPWAAVTLNKFSIKPDGDYVKKNAEEIFKYGVKDYSNTDLEKLIIHLTASGYSPYNFMGYNLVSELFNRDINKFYINDIIFGLISYKYANIPEEYKITKRQLVDLLLDKQLKYELNGVEYRGWALYGNRINPDITGIAINALSEFYDLIPEVKDSVDGAVQSLSKLQDKEGYLHDEYGRFSESISFAILGLTSIGINPEGILFTKERGDLVSALLSFKGTNGQFKHSLDGGNNYIATEQALRALIALQEFKNTGKYDFYKSSINSEELSKYNYVPSVDSNQDGYKSKGSFISKNSKVVNENTYENESASTDEGKEKNAVDSMEEYKGEIIKNEAETILKLLERVPDGTVIKIDASQNTRVSKEVFDSIKGTNKILSFEVDGLVWIFRGTDITQETKDIDLGLNKLSEHREKILGKVKGAYIVSFKDNGILPGKAEVRIKLDSGWLNGKNRNNIYLYYYNAEEDKIEKISGPLGVDYEGYITINITHCSDYFLIDRDLTAVKDKGNITTIGWIGIGFMIAGAAATAVMLIRNNVRKGKVA
ncbi:hypothetical protein [Fonticella tunisiensis]|uniref:DUF4430 domain-containing protein n=1 Tax=Fonticella tunisiensis TaxID=1096341 RepID=A0A4R7KAH2_9CLOT|nr:hypothetical protein [Fonticella tunisiensis]TDT50725.1 hypothetical protein EDD71_12511 [Fonticella tunisiensis]